MKKVTRRRFLGRAAAGAAAAGAFAAPQVRVAFGSPNEQIPMAVVGFNGMGFGHVRRLLELKSQARITMLCDVDPQVRTRGADAVKEAGGGEPKLVKDFRHVADARDVDATVVATPHHWHVPMALQLLRGGKDAYVEKPASHVFSEGRALADAARRLGRIVQHGTQTRSAEFTTKAREVIASGILGEVRMAKAWNVQKRRHLEPKPDSAPPPGVDYDLWLGPAPKRPFNENRFHRTWRQFRDYGNGDIGDDGAHDIDIGRWLLGVSTHPVRITSHGSRAAAGGLTEYPDNMSVAYEYADGRVLLYEDRMFTPYGLHGFDSGNAFYGTKGYMIFSRRGYFQVYLGRKEEKGPGMKQTSARARYHMQDFLASVRSRKSPIADADEAHLTCGVIHLGEVGYRVGRVLKFNPDTEQIEGDPEAQALLTKEYRTPWSLPTLG